MIGRLVAAQVWRIRWHLLFLFLLGAMSAVQNAEPSFTSRLSMGWPLLTASTAITMLGIFWSREVRVLPIPRRAPLRSAWLAALALPIAIMTGRVLATLVKHGLGFSGTVSGEAILLTAVWDTLFIGVSLTIMQRPDDPWESVRQTFASLRKSAKLAGHLVWILAVPFAGPELVPTSIAEVTWIHMGGIVAGIAATVWPLLMAPDQLPSLGVLHDAPRGAGSTPSRTERAPGSLDRLKGLERLLPGPVGIAALVAALTLAAATALTFSIRGVHSPFAAGMNDVEFFLIGGPLFLLFLGPFSWGNGVTPYLRTLRTLPVSAMKLVITVTMLPMAMPVFFWLLATGVHVVVGSTGDTRWRLESFVLLCAVMAFFGAVHARFNSVLVLLAGAVVPLFGLMALLMLVDKATVGPVIAFWFPVIGLAGLPAAFLLNYLTISRGSSSSAVYKPAPGESLYRGGVS